MKLNPIPLLTALLLSISSYAQIALSPREDRKYELLLKSGSIIPEKNITSDKINELNRKAQTQGKSFLIIQFERIPTEAERKQLQQAGIELLDYVPNNAYTVTVSGPLNTALLAQVKVRAILALTPEQKMQSDLAHGIYPAWAVKVQGTVDVWISFPKTFSFETVKLELQKKNFDIITTKLRAYHIIGLQVATQRLSELAGLPFIEFVQPAPPEDKPINYNSTTDSRASILSSSGGRNLKGQGIVIGVGDNTDPQTHIDFTNRLIGRAALPYVNSGSSHGTHVAGTVGGAGIGREINTGYVPKARLITQNFSGILVNASAYVQDDSMMITNNSYEITNGICSYHGVYDLYSQVLDQQAFDLPKLQHVFAAGNSGGMTCTPYPAGFQTVAGSYQAAKNVIDVGWTANTGAINANSSKGPVKDGRIKPEICALGTSVTSSIGSTANNYGNAQGTSMSAPAVTGGFAMLYQRYKELNSDINPKSGLMKALICNGGRDLGNTGPDYTYGFGWMNLLRSVDMLENSRYIISSIANSAINTHNITVPANTAELKVMLYWHDPPAAVLSSQTLVNDVDLEVTDPLATLFLPFILDTVPANVNTAATTGADHINNIEQVVITNPATGAYTLTIKGTAITQNPSQEYFLVYDFVPVETVVTHPAGGEKLIPGETRIIQWDSYGSPANTFTVQYSTDNGSNWTDINTTVAANLRQFTWTVPTTVAVPSIVTNQALIRVTRNSSAISGTSQPFTIVGVPTVSLSTTQCEGYIALQWTAVTSATDYEVMLLQGDEMVSRGTTTATNFTLSGLSKDSVYWFSVRARVNGNPGRRANAISRQPNTGTCAGTISNNDLKIDAILAPVSGRELTSSALTAATIISIRVKNLDDATINNFNVKYSVDGAAFVSEPATNIAAGATYTHNFAATYDFSTVGIYELRVVVENISAADPVGANDTMTVIIKQLPNAAITLSIGNDFLDDIETADDSTYYNGQIGLSGADRFDFVSTTAYGRVRSFVNTGIAYSGNMALTLDADRYNAGGTADSLKATFNLLPHFNTADDIRLDFVYKNHSQGPDNANKVWIRGDDTKPWIEVYDLYANQNDPGFFKKSSSIELSDILADTAQDFSTSFQVRFGQWGQLLTADNESGAGYTFDDIHLYMVENDIQMISLDTPVVASCGLNSTTQVRATVRNSADATINNIPVKYTIDGGAVISETIAFIVGNADTSYTFTTTADLSATGSHTIQVWVDYAGDSFHDNDTVTVTIINSPIITSYPYLENFEAGDGSWHTSGKNNSWEYGTPASTQINRAASGSKAWKTNLIGSYKDRQFSYLYSPCFDITGMSNPTLSLSIALDLEDCGGTLCDGAFMEYSEDGVAWTRLGASGQGTNWYNKNYTSNNLWSVEDYTNWHVATIPLPNGFDRLRLRFVVTTDAFVNREGIAVDDIHIYDNIYGIYDGPPYTSNTVNQPTVNGSNWIDFVDGGKLIASVNPNGQNLGSTNTRVYINTSAVRTNSGQYYHDRNITIKPANRNLADSATIRFYFLDTETENLINATGCLDCTKPTMVQELGVSKYTDADTTKENGTIADNNSIDWLFINSANVIKVPFDNGYYAEFKVKDFSEFWLNNGGLNNDHSLPVELISFTAKKKMSKDVLAEWVTASESNTDRFEIELAKGNNEFQLNHFIKIGEVSSNGNSTTEQHYSFTDLENNKYGVRYYRLKIVDHDGRFSYSAVRPVVFNDEIKWQVYPNPSVGVFNFVYQINERENINMKVYDVNGKIVQQTFLSGNGFVQKLSIDLQSARFASGLYLLEAVAGEKKDVFRLIKK